MTGTGTISLLWGDEERTFRLGIGEWRKVQEKCDAGPAEIMARLGPVFAATRRGYSFEQIIDAGFVGTWRIDDVREPLYRGLIGGGMEPTAAGKIIRDLVDERPLLEAVAIAYQVVLASLVGVEEEPMGEQKGGAKKAPPGGKSRSAPSTASAPS
jgi:hypothetical protein